jgi:YHS domain-containing protein
MSRDTQIPWDPVCGRKMNRNKAWAIVRHNKVEYLLCCPRCQSEFEAEPERFVQTALKK